MLNKIVYTILGFGLAFIFFPHASHDSRKPVVSGIVTEIANAKPDKAAPEMALNLSAPILTANSAVAYDLNSRTILYSKNLDTKLPIASLTKLMTAIVTVKKSELTDEVTVTRSALLGIGNTVGLVEGERLKVSDLLEAMLIPSGNDAALALAIHVAGSPERFADYMNEEARRLNLVATSFSNPAGWDRWADKENFSNSMDMIKVVEEFLRHEELRQIVKNKNLEIKSLDGRYVHNLRTTNQLLLEDPNVVGVKTGFTSKALGNLIIQYDINDTSVLTIILSSQDREGDSRKLQEWVHKVYRW
ncbi:MAG: serine hydrolase [Candidatus Doudnabacteria bacterium]|nr:serine hydrolase [Candidatus Doudnabacteria bacterium]